MRNKLKLTCLAASVVLLVASTSWAADTNTKDAPPPPKLEKLDETDAPITITPPSSGTKIIERRGSGNELKEVEVRSGKSTYTLRPRRVPGEQPRDNIAVPQWKVKEFGKKPASEEETVPQRLEPAPAKPVNGSK